MTELRDIRAYDQTNHVMTEEEFVDWCDEDVRAEFVDGIVIVMSPDSAIHVKLFKFLLHIVDLFVSRRGLGEALGPNFQIRLRAGLRRVPDLLFVSQERSHLMQPNHFEGAPDVAFEIVSPDSVSRDWRDKYREYEQSGVREYFIIDPQQHRVHLYRQIDGKYALIAPESGVYRSEVISGFWMREEWLWQDPLPDPIEILRDLDVI